MKVRPHDIRTSLHRSVSAAERRDAPYPYWILRDVFPRKLYESLKDMPFPVADIGGVSGRREAHNAERVYFSGDNLKASEVCRATAEAFQDDDLAQLFTEAFGGRLSGTFVRIEYAQDIDGFWLDPHTDIGVKAFTMIVYISDDPRHGDLGTDIYSDESTLVARAPFCPNSAMIFIPSDRSWHGFEKRPIPGVRRSLIVNYVTDEWRAREQLAFPHHPVLADATIFPLP